MATLNLHSPDQAKGAAALNVVEEPFQNKERIITMTANADRISVTTGNLIINFARLYYSVLYAITFRRE